MENEQLTEQYLLVASTALLHFFKVGPFTNLNQSVILYTPTTSKKE